MSRLPLISLTALCLTACATGEPIDELDRALQLAEDEPTALVTAEFVVEVTDEGRPVIADDVFGWSSTMTDDSTDAYCMVHAGVDRCAQWFVSFEGGGPMTILADVCGELYSQPFHFAIEPAAESFTFQSHITVEADATNCGRALPYQCENGSFASPALEVETVDITGSSVGVRGLTYELEGIGLDRADCLEGPKSVDCSLWASKHTDAGRYRASAEICGMTFRTEWVTIELDESGCKPIPQRVELVVDEGACGFSG